MLWTSGASPTSTRFWTAVAIACAFSTAALAEFACPMAARNSATARSTARDADRRAAIHSACAISASARALRARAARKPEISKLCPIKKFEFVNPIPGAISSSGFAGAPSARAAAFASSRVSFRAATNGLRSATSRTLAASSGSSWAEVNGASAANKRVDTLRGIKARPPTMAKRRIAPVRRGPIVPYARRVMPTGIKEDRALKSCPVVRLSKDQPKNRIARTKLRLPLPAEGKGLRRGSPAAQFHQIFGPQERSIEPRHGEQPLDE